MFGSVGQMQDKYFIEKKHLNRTYCQTGYKHEAIQ